MAQESEVPMTTTTTTIEKLWVQIFERKARILDQIEQQTRLFDQNLAAKLLIDGITPPPWLLNSDHRSRAELNAEDLISEVLLSRPRPTVPFSFSRCPVFEEPVAEAANGELPNGLSAEECAQNDDLDAGGESSVLLRNPINNAGLASVGVSAPNHCITSLEGRIDEDPSITSPQDQRDMEISDINHELALSLARLQRSRSRQKALELRSSSKVVKCQFDEENSQSGYSGGNKESAVPFQDDQFEELNFANSLDTNNGISAVADVGIGGARSKEKSGSIYSGRITRSKSSDRQHSALNVASSSNVGREDDGVLAVSIAQSIQRSNHKNQTMESINDLQIGCQNCKTIEAKVGDKKRKEIGSSIGNRRITRSTSSTQQNTFVSELLVVDGSGDYHEESDISNQRRQAQIVNIKEESCGRDVKLGRQHVATGYSGRIKRSRSSHQSNRSSPTQKKLELSVVVGNSANTKSPEGHISRNNVSLAITTTERVPEAMNSNVDDPVINEQLFAISNRSPSCERTKVPAERSLLIRQDEEPCVANSTDSSDKEDVLDEYVGRNTRTEPASTTEVTSRLVVSQDFGRRVTRSISAASHKALETKSSNRLESNGHEKVPNIDMIEQPCTSTNEPANLEGSASTIKETELGPDGQVKAHSGHLGSNNGAGAAELKVSAPCPSSSSMPVEPRQLNFDDVEMSRFNGIPAVPCRDETAGRLVEKSPPTLIESASELTNRMSKNFLEHNTLPLKEKDDLSTEKVPRTDFAEAIVEDTDTAILTLNGHGVSPANETSHAEMAIITHQFQQSNKNTEENSSLTGINLPSEAKTGTPVAAVPAESVPKDSITETLYSVDRELSKEADYLLVTRPDLFENQDESRKSLAQETQDLDISQCRSHNAEFTERSSCGDANVLCSQLTQSHNAAKSVGKSNLSSPVEGSLTQSKWRRSGSLDNLDSAPGMKKNSVLQFEKGSESRDLLNDHSPKDLQTSQVAKDDVAQLVISRCQVEERHQLEEHNMHEGSEWSSELQSKEADFSLEERNTSSGVKKAVGDCDGKIEEAREADPTSINNDIEWQHILEANGNSSHHEDEFRIGNTESLTSSEAVMQERKCDSEGTVKLTYGSLDSPYNQSLLLAGADSTMPVLEGFILQSDDEQLCSIDEEISFDNLSLAKNAIERAGILEQLCKSACMKTPVTCSSTPYKLHKVSNLYRSVPTGLLEGMDMKNKHLINEEFTHAFQGRPHSDSFQSSTIGHEWDTKKPCLSPVRKVWDRIISKSGSSEKRRSLNPELPRINEESENIEEVAETYQDGIVSEMVASSVKRKPLAGIDENRPESEAEPYADRFSLDSVNTEFSFKGTHDKNKNNTERGKSIKRRYNNKKNENLSLGEASRNGKMGSLQSRLSKQKLSAKTSSKNGVPGFAVTEPKRNNIVSNITSFIPLVQQKQAAAIPTGKRDVKVKALEAAEAAKRLAEKKENERKIKKEAMKLERARQEQENMKQLELQKKRKEEERKKKEADMAAKKRQREEEEKKEKARKRLRLEETRKQQRENEQKLQAAKEEKDKLQSSVVTNLDKPKRTESLIASPSQEPSYDISPYKCSDDEDEDEDDDRPNTKFMPSWACKSAIASAISSQDGESLRAIFHLKSFPSIDEVLLPRRFRLK